VWLPKTDPQTGQQCGVQHDFVVHDVIKRHVSDNGAHPCQVEMITAWRFLSSADKSVGKTDDDQAGCCYGNQQKRQRRITKQWQQTGKNIIIVVVNEKS
jgi:hypothetical protein